MRTWNMSVCAVLVCASMARAEDPAQTQKPGFVHLNPKDMKWGDAPPDLPKGAKLTVLHGDPTKAGPFTMRLKAPSGYRILPHWHSNDENLTVIAGTLILHMGDTMKAKGHSLPVGGYHFLPAKMHHAAETKGETIVQIAGEGPFDIHYLNPADNPNPKSAKRRTTRRRQLAPPRTANTSARRRPARTKIGRLRLVERGTRLAEQQGVELVVAGFVALTFFALGQMVVAWASTTLRRTRYWGLPALLFGAASIAAFAKGAAVPPPEGGGPPILDFGPLPYYALGFAALVAAMVALAAGGRARKQYLDQQQTATPELAVAIVHDR